MIETAYRFTRSIPNVGMWDEDSSGPEHAVEYGRTLCGVLVGSREKGWRMSWVHSAEQVECKRCRKALAVSGAGV